TGTGDSVRPAISGNGRFVSFDSTASNLHPDDGDTTLDVFRRDVLGGDSSPQPPPTISGFLPASGVGGTLVTINGSALAGATDVEFGGGSASFTVVSDSKITASVPRGAPRLSPIPGHTPLPTLTS